MSVISHRSSLYRSSLISYRSSLISYLTSHIPYLTSHIPYLTSHRSAHEDHVLSPAGSSPDGPGEAAASHRASPRSPPGGLSATPGSWSPGEGEAGGPGRHHRRQPG